MEIRPVLRKRLLEDYDFIFSSGLIKPITIDRSLGDDVEFTEGGVTITLAARPSFSDPDEFIPAEKITVFSNHLICIEHRKREVEDRTPEEKEDWLKNFKNVKEVTKTIQ